jgi:hypothetical protein
MTRTAILCPVLLATGVFFACSGQTALATDHPSNSGEQPVEPDEHLFGGAMDADEANVVSALTPGQVTAIDAAILHDVSPRWSKVAMVLGRQLKARPGIPRDIPLEYYWQRLSLLVDQGRVEVQGDLRRARYSEVRLR